MNPLAWVLGITTSALLIALRVPQTPLWLLSTLGTLPVVVLIAFLTAYFILLFKNPDALRSEKFTLSKMAIEKSLTGDSLRGFIDSPVPDRAIATSITATEEQSL
jgi:hypothetical protein